MKQKHVYKVWGKKTDEGERFEKWLMEDRFGIGKCRNGSRLQERLIYLNLEQAARAPFDTDAKVSVLSSLFMPSQPNKALLVLNALFEIAKEENSEHAREAFESAATKWLADVTLRHLSMRAWAKGTILIINAASELDSPQLKREIRRVADSEVDAGVQIEFWKKMIPLGCGVP